MLTPAEQRKFLKTTIEQIFIQQIYSAVIRALIAFGGFELRTDQIDFLARTFYREKLGSNEAACVCLGPAWEHNTHKGDECEKKQKERNWKEALTAVLPEGVIPS